MKSSSSLMLIESPNKVNTISRYLSGTDIKIMATVGHFRELDEKKFNGLGFDEKTYEMCWRNDSIKNIKGRPTDIIKEINREADKCEKIYLSTDPDREGEAISWHIYSVLNENNRKKCSRIVFNEITKTAIKNALENPRDLDEHQINSYLARKLLDRGLGFKLSNFVGKAAGGASAGRVQSIALKFLKDRDLEIKNFVPEHWFNVDVLLENGLNLTLKILDKKVDYKLHKTLKNGLVNFLEKEEAEDFRKSLKKEYKLISIENPTKEKRKPPKPFKTSTLQSTAINQLHIGASNVDRIAQKLYEGVEIDGEFISLITYPRTDRVDLSETFTSSAKNFIKSHYSSEYLGRGGGVSAKNDKNKDLVQGAHEAIRPTYIEIFPEKIKGKVEESEYRMYALIWSYAVASLMAEAQYESITYKFENQKHIFVTHSRREIFDGYKRLQREFCGLNMKEDEENIFPQDLKVNEKYMVKTTEVKQVDKKPPSHYTEASLIDALESEGIGRPSTYSHIVSIVLKRGYAEKDKAKLLITNLGIEMADVLEKFFPEIMRYEYTRNMEKELDSISENKSNWKKFLDNVFELFAGELQRANKSLDSINMVGRECPKCKSPLTYRFSQKSRQKYIKCTNSPSCEYIEWVESGDRELLDEKCPECDHVLVKKKNRWGNYFVSCTNYPRCKFIKQEKEEYEELDKKCPECDHVLAKKKNRWGRYFVSCTNYPKCKYIESDDQKELLEEECEKCRSKLVKLMSKKWNKPYIRCSAFPNCKYFRTIKSTQENE